MVYPVAVGFVLLKLNGLKMRVTNFKLKKIAGASERIDYSNVASNVFELRPGRYAIVPFTHVAQDRIMEYTISCNFFEGCVEFEINDILVERPIDEVLSDEDDDDEEEEGDVGSEVKGTKGGFL